MTPLARSLTLLSALLLAVLAVKSSTSEAQAPDKGADFLPIHAVFVSPRCRNCHPAGDAPLQGERGTPHAMNISRRSQSAGLLCTACHRAENQPGLGAPPGVRNWHMPSSKLPMVFEGRTPAELCTQLKDRAQNGGRKPQDLVQHVREDQFVRWAWNPGPGRAPAPATQADLVAHMERWVRGGAICPR